jgi:hypothetical protein
MSLVLGGDAAWSIRRSRCRQVHCRRGDARPRLGPTWPDSESPVDAVAASVLFAEVSYGSLVEG